MKNILVPTDFSVQSLQLVHQIVKSNPRGQVRIYLVHMLKMPTDIMDLLFLKKHQLYQYVPDSFKQAIEMLKNKYPAQIEWMGVEFYYGSSVSILNDVLESRRIDEGCILRGYKYGLPLAQSVDMKPLLNRSKAIVLEIPVLGKVSQVGEANFLSALFTEEYQVAPTAKLTKQD